MSREGYNRQTSETRSMVLALNIADDYFKAKKQGSVLEDEMQQKDKEMYDLKHELISIQIRCESLEQEIERLKEENQQLQMQIVKLETEMDGYR
jgi:cell division protein ZapA